MQKWKILFTIILKCSTLFLFFFHVCQFFKKEIKIKWSQIVLDYRLFTIT